MAGVTLEVTAVSIEPLEGVILTVTAREALTINVASSDCDVEVPPNAGPGDVVRARITPDEGYEIIPDFVTVTSGTESIPFEVDGDEIIFTMPDNPAGITIYVPTREIPVVHEGVYVDVTAIPDNSGFINYLSFNCSLLGPEIAVSGEEISVTVLPIQGYNFVSSNVEVFDDNGNIPFVVNGLSIGFVQPYNFANTTVKVTCVEDNPYAPGGESEPGEGGGGSFDNPEDVIAGPDLPSTGAVGSGMVTLYLPTNAEMLSFTGELFNANIFDQLWWQTFGKPFDYIVSLGVIPDSNIPKSSSAQAVKCGPTSLTTTMKIATAQRFEVSCGTLTIPEYWKSFLDYEPFSRLNLYLPYCGYKDISPSEIIGKECQVTYHIDIFTGSCVAFVIREGSVLYQFEGNCLEQIPYAQQSFSNLLSAIQGLAGAGLTLFGIQSAGLSTTLAGRIMGINAIGTAGSSIVSMPKQSVSHGGSMSGNAGRLMVQKPFFILTRPQQSIPENYGKYVGYPANYYANTLGTLSGFTQVQAIHLDTIQATDYELAELDRMLKEGVIF